MSRFAVIVLLLWGPAFAQQDQPSLAERAAALRKKTEVEATPTATPAVSATPLPAATRTPAPPAARTGTPTPVPALNPLAKATATATARATPRPAASVGNDFGNNDYENDALELEIKCPSGWNPMDLGELAGHKTVSPAKFRVQNGAEIVREATNVYALHDAAGSRIVLTLVQFHPEDPLPLNLRSDIQRAIALEDPRMRLTQEAVPLDDSSHHFAAFRAFNLEGSRFESVQAMVYQGYLIQFVVEANSQERVSTIL